MEKTMTRTFRSVLVAIGLVAAASATAAEKYELSLSTYLPPSYEYIYKPLESFAKRAEEKSQGRLKINIFHSGQLFDGYEELAALSRGDIDLTNFSGSYAGGSILALNIFTLPFLLNDMPHPRISSAKCLLPPGTQKTLDSPP